MGYVVKARAGSELLAAVGDAIRGKPFVSDGLAVRAPARPADDQVRDRHHPGEALPNLSDAAD
jgi:hypothetical protein